MAQGLIVLIEDKGYPVIDISAGGLSFQAAGYRPGDVVTLKIAQTATIENCVEGKITVVKGSEGITRGEFSMTMQLMRYVVRHIGSVLGVEPTYFR